MYCWLPHTPRPLSPRHRSIVRLRAEGLALEQIAERLGISVSATEQASARATRRLRWMSEAQRMREIWPERS